MIQQLKVCRKSSRLSVPYLAASTFNCNLLVQSYQSSEGSLRERGLSSLGLNWAAWATPRFHSSGLDSSAARAEQREQTATARCCLAGTLN